MTHQVSEFVRRTQVISMPFPVENPKCPHPIQPPHSPLWAEVAFVFPRMVALKKPSSDFNRHGQLAHVILAG